MLRFEICINEVRLLIKELRELKETISDKYVTNPTEAAFAGFMANDDDADSSTASQDPSD